uniref:TRAP transporter solute receptor, TAXI family n=1 Tax=Candidatus Kentrum eta TaxID=2126337 RepID=A0A450USV0_9GAMM|nr:MAG: hypothetical protein BECKH772A_GA0070896_100912 [Candidatus Kentron sp. H]VFK02450.1 MAG: hypothetical protein BECKH772C_GA0070978_100912 [Candidatus Kentron sp. H]
MKTWARLLFGLFVMGTLAFPASGHAQKVLKAHGPAPDGGSYTATIAVSKMLEKHTEFRMQIQAGQTGTKSMVQLARGRIDFTLIPVNAVTLMRERKAMYRKLESAPALAAKLRGLMVWECCSWHYLAYADTGIKSFGDFKGKKIYTGPPGSVAKHILEGMMGATGLQAGEDYTPVNLDWGSGGQVFRDRNVDVLIQAAPMGSPVIEQFAVSRKVRIIGLPDMDKTPKLKEMLSAPGSDVGIIPPDTYKGVVNEAPVKVLSMRHMGGVGLHVDPDIVYAMTRAIWENMEEFYAYGAHLRKVNRALVFKSMNIPLHVGAYRYYKENGFEIPEDLIPPEAE